MNRERNLDLLAFAALKLQPVLEQLVFVGGSTVALFVTDPAAADVRATDDVDVIVDVHTAVGYHRVCGQLRKLGFREDAEGGVICRWRLDGLTLDVMPVNGKVLGFANRWYPQAVKNSFEHALGNALRMRVTQPPWFIATKLEAFHDRGNRDFLASHDLEDIITVVDSRATLVTELAEAPTNIRKHVASEIAGLLGEPRFLEALPGLVLGDSPARAVAVERRLRLIAGLG